MASMTTRSLLRTQTHRSFSTSQPRLVPLSFDHHPPPPSTPHSSHGPLVILHGLFGSKQNWQSMAKRMAQKIGTDVYTLDLRNHGESPATPGKVSYSDYASDAAEFIDSRNLKNVTLIGHSMGGKVAMSLALQPHSALTRLVSVDMAPAIGPLSPVFSNYLNAMQKIDDAKVETKKEADTMLIELEPDLSIRQFLLTNLKRNPGDSKQHQFRLPLSVLREQLESNEIGSFPYQPGERSWQGPALFVKGSESKYINRKSMICTPGYFPNHTVKILEAGHWVHAEKPVEFIQVISDFVEGKTPTS